MRVVTASAAAGVAMTATAPAAKAKAKARIAILHLWRTQSSGDQSSGAGGCPAGELRRCLIRHAGPLDPRARRNRPAAQELLGRHGPLARALQAQEPYGTRAAGDG